MFGLGFAEILIIAVIAILFLGPDKLPSAMVNVAKFFRQAKNTIGTVKDSLEQEMNVSEIKAEALAYKKELLSAQDELKKESGIADFGAELGNLNDDIMADLDTDMNAVEPEPATPKPKEERVTFKKEKKKNKEDIDV